MAMASRNAPLPTQRYARQLISTVELGSDPVLDVTPHCQMHTWPLGDWI